MNETNVNILSTEVLKAILNGGTNMKMLIFCGEDSHDYSSEYMYTQADIQKVEVEELALYNGEVWLDRVEYLTRLVEDLSDDNEENDGLAIVRFNKMIHEKMSEVEFEKIIAVYVD